MAHRRMIIRERLTAIIGSAILFALVATKLLVLHSDTGCRT